jgi:hypothetical protein
MEGKPTMKVRMIAQVSGTRDGQNWPEPGTVLDVPDAEARALISGGSAVEDGGDSDMVLVPPAGIHVPGSVAYGPGVQQLIEVPANAAGNPQGTRDALQARADNDMVEVPAGVGVQHPSGAAMTRERVDQSVEDEQVNRDQWASQVGVVGQAPAKAPPKKAADKTTADK